MICSHSMGRPSAPLPLSGPAQTRRFEPTSQAPYPGKSHRANRARAPGPDWSRDVLCASGKGGGWIDWVSSAGPSLPHWDSERRWPERCESATQHPAHCHVSKEAGTPAAFQPKNMRKPGVSGTCIDYRHSPRERRATAPLTSGNLSVCHLRLGN